MRVLSVHASDLEQQGEQGGAEEDHPEDQGRYGHEDRHPFGLGSRRGLLAGQMGILVQGSWMVSTWDQNKALDDQLVREFKLPGILGNRHAAGIAIVDERGSTTWGGS